MAHVVEIVKAFSTWGAASARLRSGQALSARFWREVGRATRTFKQSFVSIPSRTMSQENRFGKFAASVWAEVNDRLIVLVSDACLFLLGLFVLFLAFLALHAMARFGYPEARVDVLETLHYYFYLALFFSFMVDVVLKTVIGIAKGIRK